MKYLEHIGKEKAGKYVKMCFEAMCQLINNKYLIGSESEEGVIYERNLLISLAYFVGRNNRNKAGNCHLIGGEVNKHIFSHCLDHDETDRCWIEDTKHKLNFKTNYVCPDFLIHKYKKIEDIERGGQYLIVEAKSKTDVNIEDFCRDLFKLNVYITRLHFKNALYVFVNSTKDEIDNYIEKYDENGYYWSNDYYGKLLFLIQENEDCRPKLYKVKTQLKEAAKMSSDST